MKKPFRSAISLWVKPDFSEVEAGKIAPPRINHSKIDFESLLDAMQKLFSYPPHVNIRVANDTIDQITTHRRGETIPSIRCEDFGAAMLLCAKKQKGSIIDVRSAWSKLHILSDRDFAPPPVALPFIIESDDFEDAMFWQSNTYPIFGLPPFSFSSPNTSGPSKLPELFRKQIGDIFGCQFTDFALLDRMETDKLPKYIQEMILEQ